MTEPHEIAEAARKQLSLAREAITRTSEDAILLRDAIAASLDALRSQVTSLDWKLLELSGALAGIDRQLAEIKPPRKTVRMYRQPEDTNDTPAFQRAADAGDVYIDDGGVYVVDVVDFCRVTKNGTTFDIHPDARIKAIDNAAPRTYFFYVDADDCVLNFNGAQLWGDRYTHAYVKFADNPKNNTHEWGFGIFMRGSRNKLFGARIFGVPGDGIGITGADHEVAYCETDDCRRNGISIYRCTGYDVHDNKFMRTGNLTTGKIDPAGLIGPFAGIDNEPDKGSASGMLRNNECGENQKAGIVGWVRDEVVDSFLDLVLDNNRCYGSPNATWFRDEMARAPRIKVVLTRNTLEFINGANVKADQGCVAHIGTASNDDANVMSQKGKTRVPPLLLRSGKVTQWDIQGSGTHNVGVNSYK